MLREIRTQFNVIKALTIHNLQGQMSSYNYGFAWLLLEPLIFIAGFRLARQFFGSMASPASMTPLMFYVLGVIPLYIVFDGIRVYAMIASPSKMLMFPRVTPIDIAIANSAGSFSIYFILFWAVAIPVSIYEKVWPPQNILEVLLVLLLCWPVGIAIGFALSGAYRVFPPIKQFVGYAVFGLRMASGLFFCIVMIPVSVWPYLTWNPMLHVTELARDAWFESYVSPVGSFAYVLECLLGLSLLGLSVERFLRRIPFA